FDNTDGSLTAKAGHLTIATHGDVMVSAGQHWMAGQDVTLQANSLTNDGEVSAQDNTLLALDNELTNHGLVSGQSTTVTAQSVTNSGQLQSLSDLGLTADALDNSGTLAALNDITLNVVNQLSNSGTVSADHDASLLTDNLSNHGRVFAGNDLLIAKYTNQTRNTTFDNTDGSLTAKAGHLTIATHDDVSVSTGQHWVAGQNLTLQANSLTNDGEVSAQVNTSLTLNNAFTNHGLVSGQSTAVTAQSVTNSGQLQSLSDLGLTADALDNSGTLAALNDITLNVANQLSNSGVISANHNASLLTDNLSNHGRVFAAHDLLIARDTNQTRNTTFDNTDGSLMAKAGHLTVATHGDVSVSAGQHWVAGQDLTVHANSLTNDGEVSAQGNTALTLDHALTNHGLVSGQSTTVTTQSVTNSGQLQSLSDLGLTAYALDNSGTLVAFNDVDLTVTDRLLNLGSGTVLAGENIKLSAAQIDNQGRVSAGDGAIMTPEQRTAEQIESDLIVTADTLTNSGELLAQGNNQLTINTDLTNQIGGLISGQATTVKAQSVTNAGQLQSLSSLGLTADALDNSGTLAALSDMTLNVANQLSNSGAISTNHNASLLTDNLTNKGRVFAGNNLLVAKDSNQTRNTTFDNTDGSLTAKAGHLTIATHGDVMVSAGQHWMAGQDVTLQANSLTNDGEVSAQDETSLTLDNALINHGLVSGQATVVKAQSVTNTGQLQSLSNLGLTTDALTNSGTLAALSDITLNVANRLSNSGAISASHNASLLTDNLTNKGRVFADNNLLIAKDSNQTRNTIFDNTNGSLTAKAGHLTVATYDDVSVSIGQHWVAGQNLTLQANSLTNDGEVSAQGNTSLTLNHVLTNHGLVSGQKATITSQSVTNTGQLQSLSDLGLTVNALTNSGTLAALNDITLNVANQLSNSGVISANHNASLLTDNLSNHGRVFAGHDLLIARDSDQTRNSTFDNTDGSLTAKAGYLTIATHDDVSVSAGQHWVAGQDVTLQANSLTNDGEVSAQSNTALALDNNLTNHGLVSGQSTTVTTQSVTNSGQLQSLSDLGLTTDALDNSGTLAALNDMTLNVANWLSNSGAISANHNASLLTDNLTNKGRVFAGNNLLIAKDSNQTRNTTFDNTDGSLNAKAGHLTVATHANVLVSAGQHWIAGQDLTLQANSLTNNGEVSAQGNTALILNYALTNHGLISGQSTTVATQFVTNNGQLQALTDLGLNADTLANTGALVAGRNAVFNIIHTLTSQGNISAGNNASLLADQVNNQNKVYAGNSVLIAKDSAQTRSSSLINSGQIDAKYGNISIATQGDFTVGAGQHISAGKDLTLVAAALTNDGELSSQGTTNIGVDGTLTNYTAGIISGQNTVLRAGTTTNQGQLQGLNDLHLTTGTLTNTGSLVALNDMTVHATGHIDNHSLFYAGRNGNLFSDTLTNYSDIVVGNDLLIARDSNKTRSRNLTNSSGSIESLGGNIGIYADSVLNKRTVLDVTSQTQDLRGSIPGGGSSSFTRRINYLWDHLWFKATLESEPYSPVISVWIVSPADGVKLVIRAFGSGKTISFKAYQEGLVLKDSSQASIIKATNGLIINANDVQNLSSSLLGRNISIFSQSLSNVGYKFNTTEVYFDYALPDDETPKTTYCHLSNRCKSGFTFHYNLVNTRKVEAGTTSILLSTITATNTLNLKVQNRTNNSVIGINAAGTQPTKSAYTTRATQGPSGTQADVQTMQHTPNSGQGVASTQAISDSAQSLQTAQGAGTAQSVQVTPGSSDTSGTTPSFQTAQGSGTVQGIQVTQGPSDASGTTPSLQTAQGAGTAQSVPVTQGSSDTSGTTPSFQTAQGSGTVQGIQVTQGPSDASGTTPSLQTAQGAGAAQSVPVTQGPSDTSGTIPSLQTAQGAGTAQGIQVTQGPSDTSGTMPSLQTAQGTGTAHSIQVTQGPSDTSGTVQSQSATTHSMQLTPLADDSGTALQSGQAQSDSGLAAQSTPNMASMTRPVPQGGKSATTVTLSNSSAVTAPTLNLPNQNSIPFPDYRLPTSPHGLFVFSDGPQSDYLIATNPAVTNLNNFLGSDYFKDQLNYDPEQKEKFLGDAYYDTRTITQEIFEQTGKRYLSDDIGSDLAQMKQLIDSAAQQKNSLNLKNGVALTDEQIARLSHDIIWYEPIEVNGQMVMAPKLYLSSASQNNISNGALLAGRNIDIGTGDFANSGSVNAREDLKIASRGGISNTRGTLSANDDLALIATGDIVNQSGVIDGGRVQLQTTSGSVVNETLANKTDYGNGFVNTDIGPESLIQSRTTLGVSAGQDIVSQGAAIRAGEGTVLLAGGNVTFGAIARETQKSFLDGGTRRVIQDIVHLGSTVSSGGDLTIQAGNNLHATNADLSAQGNLILTAGHDITLDTAVDTAYRYSDGGGHTHKLRTTTNQGSNLSGNDVLLQSGNDTTLVSSGIQASGNVALNAKGDVNILAANDSRYEYSKSTHKKSFGRSKTTIHESLNETVRGSSIAAGGDITIKAQKYTKAKLAGGDSDIQVVGSNLNAGDTINLSADGDVILAAQQYREYEYNQTIKKGFGGLSGSNRGNLDDATLLEGANTIAASHININSGNDIGVIASTVSAGGDVNMQALDEVLVTADNILRQTQQWDEKSSFLSGGHLMEMSSDREGMQSSTAQGSQIASHGNVNIQGGSVALVGSDVVAGENTVLKADTGDLDIRSAQNSIRQTSQHKKISVDIPIFEMLSHPESALQITDGQIRLQIGKATYDQVDNQTTATTQTGSNVLANNDVSLGAANDLTVTGSRIAADQDGSGAGDLSLAADNILIQEAKETEQTQSKEIHGKAGASLVVQHQSVEVAKAVKGVQEATKALKQAKQDYQQYKKQLASLQGTLATLQADYAAKKPGVTFEDIEELQDLVSDLKGDEAWYATGVALAAENLTSKITLWYKQGDAAIKSMASGAFGFDAGLHLDIDANKQNSQSLQVTSVGSQLSGQNVTIEAGHQAGQSATVQGSVVQAEDTLAVSGNQVNLLASDEQNSNSNGSESAHVGASVTLFGANSGINLDASYSRNETVSNSQTHTNSVLSADHIQITSDGNTDVNGASVAANEQLDISVGGDLNVASVQNRYSSTNHGGSVSGGLSLSGGDVGKGGAVSGFDHAGSLQGVNGGVNLSNGRSHSRETVQTSITAGGDANISVGGNTDIKGATIATVNEDGSDAGKLHLKTGTLSYTDLSNTRYTSSLNAGVSMSVGIGKDKTGSTQIDASRNSSRYQYTNQSGYHKSKTLATVGQGVLRIEDTHNSDDTERLNRDITNTTKDLYSVDRQQGNVDVTVDHRLLSETGQNEIAEDITDVNERGEDALHAAGTVLSKEGTGLGNLLEVYGNNKKLTSFKNELERNPKYQDLVERLNSSDGDTFAVAEQEALNIAQQEFGLKPNEVHFYNSSETTTASLQDNITRDVQGATVTDGDLKGESVVDVSGQVTKESINTTIGQELGRQKDLQTGTAGSETERTSINEAMGEQYARRLGQLDTSGSYSDYSADFADSLQNSHAAAQGTQFANRVSDAPVMYRQLHPQEMKAVESLSDQLAQKTGMSSDKAEKLLAQVAAGRVDEKWSEVYKLDDASIADDVAVANELLDGFAEAQGKELLKDDDVVANWFSEDPESDVYKDTSLLSENLTSGVEVNHPSGYPQSEAAGPVARNPEYLNFYKKNLEVAVADTYQGKLTAEQLSAMKAGATQSLDDMVDAVKQLPEVAEFAASHPVLFGKAMAKAYTQMLTDNQRDTGEMLALRMMGKNEEAQQVGAKHVGEMLTNIALGLGGEAAATKALEAIGKVTKTVKGALPVVDNTSLPKYTGGNGSAVVEGEFAGQSSAQGVIEKTVGDNHGSLASTGSSASAEAGAGTVLAEGTTQGGSVVPNTERLLSGTPGQVTGGSSTKLGKNLNEAMGRNRSDSWAGYQAQHLIPSELKSHPILKKVGIDLDDASNGLFLPATKAKPEGIVSGLPRHTGSHPNYTEAVRQSLNNMDRNLPVEQLQKQVYDLQVKLRNVTESGMPVRNVDGAKTDVWLKWINK
ncbi:adhesin HecA family 20-residue repeat-containing protein, partial [Vibrio gazogenes DSM 21264]